MNLAQCIDPGTDRFNFERAYAGDVAPAGHVPFDPVKRVHERDAKTATSYDRAEHMRAYMRRKRSAEARKAR